MKQTVQDSKERRKRLEGGERGEEKGERDRGKNNEERNRGKEKKEGRMGTVIYRKRGRIGGK